MRAQADHHGCLERHGITRPLDQIDSPFMVEEAYLCGFSSHTHNSSNDMVRLTPFTWRLI